ncbi:unnamed protein product [Prorocentrum cordatum]|uniref:tRNA-dihydrouridine(16/17) synthase [NAD(P)(+)] n=1 Tax=Prorocentrum cordatum TaxID=2364126 RepID=A0ABN9QI80_9DINO|nr:unnamed protein product [Polarella glacialis]
MVGGSELAFRLLARRYGAQLCYTPMMHADRFAADAAYRAAELQTCPSDMPLVAHFCGNDPATLLAAACLAEPHCVAVDLNLGCPQRAAHSGCFGSFCRRLGDPGDAMDTALVLDIVSTLAAGLTVPLFVKIRLFDELDDTLRFCRQLEAAGCALLAVHGRYRGSPTHKRDGAAHLDQVAAVKRALTIPVLTNGNVSNAEDLLAALELTGADGVMSAEGALDDPAIFGRAVALARQRRRAITAELNAAKALQAEAAAGRALDSAEQQAVAGIQALKKQRRALPAFASGGTAPGLGTGMAEPPGALDLAGEYLALARSHRPTLRCVLFHLRRICRDPLRRFGMREALEALGSSVSETVREQPISNGNLKAATALLRKLRDYDEGRAAPPAPAPADAAPTAAEAAAAAATAAAAVAAAAARARAVTQAGGAKQSAAAAAACAAKRQEFEQMQRRKAKRKGLPDDHFLEQGRAPPTVADVARVRRMGEAERMAYWRERCGQHCIMHHLNGRCEVALTWGCGFLHEAAVP